MMSKSLLAAAAIGLTLGLGASAQGAPPPGQLPPGVFAGERDYHLAPAGAYALDPAHTAVVAKVSHIGYSLSVFRFDKVEGRLEWDPMQPAQSSLKVSVDVASIDTPVPGFAAELAGDNFLKAGAFPQATFVSTAFHRIDATHGRVDGQFTLLGQTRPLTFNVELIGAGKGVMGHPRMGVEAKATLDARQYGLNPLLGSTIDLIVDAEFAQS
jgi:polyisoprenoid-binding protein YceI